MNNEENQSLNPIEVDMTTDSTSDGNAKNLVGGEITAIADKYNNESDRLLGFALSMGFESVQFTTCDPWKRNVGGISRNQFILIKLAERLVNQEDIAYSKRLILARVTGTAPTPVESELQGTVFQIHKMQPMVDPITKQELQWSSLKANIIGTYFDYMDGNGNIEIGFGNDVDTFFYPLAYEVYAPFDDDLKKLINIFTKGSEPLEIGYLKYTETPSPHRSVLDIPVNVAIEDFIGKDNGQRTALFGKTRFGKSNTIKIIADRILKGSKKPGQIIFDPSGEYTYYNSQDNTSLFIRHAEHCVRYSLDPNRTLPQIEQDRQLPKPKRLKINFYQDIQVGHSLISELFDTQFSNRPNYMVPILNWSAPESPQSAPALRDDVSGHWHFWRTVSLWWACLALTGYDPPEDIKDVRVNFPSDAKDELKRDPTVNKLFSDNSDRFHSINVPIRKLPAIMKKIAYLWDEHGDNMFNRSSSGEPYFNNLEEQMLKILKNDGSISGIIYLDPFKEYHDSLGSNVFEEICNYAKKGKTVLVDFARANENTRKILTKRIAKKVLDEMMRLFSANKLNDNFIVMYFEEAHKLFPKEDKDLNNVYNVLAKEGAKFHISMVYATQSMTTLSPDLLKNTENFIIGHLDDDREVREVTRKYAFRDMAEDVQRIQSRGFVRMLTSSHRFALPVQIHKFEAEN